MHEFSHSIYYVLEVAPLLDFYKRAFDIDHRFVHESGHYAELDTGHTALAFCSAELAKENLPAGYEMRVGGSEVCLTTADVQASYEQALAEGATEVVPPKEKPWGQTVAYVTDPAGVLIAICSLVDE